jgi:hypothetical protein
MVLIVSCPHCTTTILVEELNCRIFRCGILKSDGNQINPHLNKSECDRLYICGLIYGCGKPFRIDMSGNPVVCDYI